VSPRTLESAGLSLVEFRLEDAIHDRWGRSEYSFAAPRGSRLVVTRPSGYDWLGLFKLDAPQDVTPGAVFTEPAEVLRFRRRIDSPYTQLWSNFPVRRRSRSGLSQSGAEYPGAEVRNT
jgi:transposase